MVHVRAHARARVEELLRRDRCIDLDSRPDRRAFLRRSLSFLPRALGALSTLPLPASSFFRPPERVADPAAHVFFFGFSAAAAAFSASAFGLYSLPTSSTSAIRPLSPRR